MCRPIPSTARKRRACRRPITSRCSTSHVQLHSELEHVDLVVLNDTTALFSGNPLAGLLPGGAIVMQSTFSKPDEVWSRIPDRHHRFIREKRIRVFYADMVQIAREVASVADLQMRMQGIVLLGAFLKLTPYGRQSGMSDEQIYAGVEKALRKYFGKRGDRVVQDNMKCVKRGYSEVAEVPAELMQLTVNAMTNFEITNDERVTKLE